MGKQCFLSTEQSPITKNRIVVTIFVLHTFENGVIELIFDILNINLHKIMKMAQKWLFLNAEFFNGTLICTQKTLFFHVLF